MTAQRVCLLSPGSSQEHVWPLLAHDLGAEDQGGHHAEQGHRERLGKLRPPPSISGNMCFDCCVLFTDM